MLIGVGPFAGTLDAMTIGPDGFGYRATDGVPFSFVDISRTGTKLLDNSDDSFTSQAIGFSFSFYGVSYTSLFVSSNGLITFGSGDANFANTALMTSPVPATIAVLWDDYVTNLSAADAVYGQVLGSPGAQRLVVQWNQVPHISGLGDGLTFEAILFEGTNDILLQYADVDTGGTSFDNGASATVGIKDSGASHRLVWSVNSAVINPSQAILFTTASIPEPEGLGLLTAGLAALGWIAWRGRARSLSV